MTKWNQSITALMMTKNEADVIVPILDRWRNWGIRIVAIDGSDDGTYEILRSYDNICVLKDKDDLGGRKPHDWVYSVLLDKKRSLFGHNDYVCIALGDEFWYSDARKIVLDMKKQNATYAQAEVVHFFLHKEDAEDWDFELCRWKTLKHPLERIKWYSWKWREERIFFDDGKCRYQENQRGCVLPDGCRSKMYDRFFLYGHYTMRDPIQTLRRCKDRVERDYQPCYSHSMDKEMREVFYEKFPDDKFDLGGKYDGKSFGFLENGIEHLR